MFEFALQIIVEGILVGIFYWPGWLVLRIVTIGRYPPPKGINHNEELVAVCGLAVLIAILGFIYS